MGTPFAPCLITMLSMQNQVLCNNSYTTYSYTCAKEIT